MPMRVVSVRLLEFKRSSHYSAVILSVGATQYTYIYIPFISLFPPPEAVIILIVEFQFLLINKAVKFKFKFCKIFLFA